MIHVFVGTKAQFIKMAPIMQELERRNIVFNFVNAGQHAKLIGELIPQFGIRKPDVSLRNTQANINTVIQALGWTVKSFGDLVFRKRKIRHSVFGNDDGICLIHGDTLTTLISMLYAKRCGLKVAHVEAGLRSFHLFDPFPEEIIRLLAMRFSDVLFAPSAWAYENLCKMKYTSKAIDVGGNTGLDAVRYAVDCADKQMRPSKPYAVITIHRVETIYSRARLRAMVTLARRIAQERKALVVLHEPTRQQLIRFGFYSDLTQTESLKILPLQPYLTFVGLLAGADFIVTDGGSVQEESYYLDVPCLIMRTKTERIEGIGQNAYLGGFNRDRAEQFLQSFPNLKRHDTEHDVHPSKAIVDHLLPWI